MQPNAASPYEVKERASAAVSFLYVVPSGISFEEATSATYWRNAWKLFENRRLSTIDLIAEDGAWEAKVRILAAAPTQMRFRTLWHWKSASADRKPPDGVTIEHIAGTGWRALTKDGTIIIEGEPSKGDAIDAAYAMTKKAKAA